ncbi:PAS domain-containing protein [Kiloniella spongiae]|uniref:PAS domain-containing protein n=1 Tax=Kiloniella spongiae TaxID=1489064 RepID=UPI00069BCE91|nr:PAS domain S-box protein [Kiloniella spongiae]
MLDLTAEIVRAAVLIILVIVIIWRRPTQDLTFQGWNYITAGFVFLAFGSFLDVTDNFPQLNQYLIIGNTPIQAVLEKLIGYLGGTLFLFIGFIKAVPDFKKLSQHVERLETAERAVERHNNFLQALLDAMPAQIFFKDQDGKYLGCNKLFQKNIELELDEIVGKTSHELFPKELADSFIEDDVKAVKSGVTDERVAVFTRPDGSHMHILMHKARFDNSDGTFAGLIGISVDISERIKAEQNLRISEERLRRLSELSNEGIIIHSDKGMSDCNDAALRMFGYAYEEMITLGAPELIAPESLDKVMDAIDTKRTGAYEAIGVRRDGSKFEVSITAKNSILHGENNRITFIRDISAQKEVESRLRKLFKAIEQNPAVIQITDPQGIVEYVNPKFTEVTGYSPDEIIGKTPNVLKSGHTPEQEYKELWETISSGNVWTGVFKNKHKNGDFFWERASISSVVNDQGEITNYVATKEDITKQRMAEVQLMQAKESAEVANRAKSEFLANMSHELRTPLNAIIGFSELMEREVFGPLGSRRYHDYLSDIRNSGDHLLKLINDILDLSKIEAGEFSLNEEQIDLQSLINSSVTIIRPRLDSGDLDLEISSATSLPNVYADERGMKQILINLLSNAVKFTPSGGKIRIEGGLDEDKVFIKVVDTGIGIPKEKLEDVMNPFTQVDAAMTRQVQGTGLGLSISQKLCQLHEGSLQLSSEEGKGTVASIILPASRIVQ